MTTNKPTLYWAPGTALVKLASRHNNAPCILTDGPAEFNDVALVRLSDYKALQAECEKLRMQLQSMVDQTTPLETVPGDPKWSRRIQLDDVIAERDRLRAVCEKLRTAMIEAKSYIDHYMYGGSAYREPAAKAIAIIDSAIQESTQ